MARKKKPKVFSRRAQTTYAAAPTDSFKNFKDYARNEIDKKETAKIIKEEVKKLFPKKKASEMMKAPEWHFTYPYYIASTIQWQRLGFDLPSVWAESIGDRINGYFADLHKAGKRQMVIDKEEAKKPQPKKRSPADIIAERTEEFIGCVEEVIDAYHISGYSKGQHDLHMDYSVFNELTIANAPYNMAKAVYDYYLPVQEEISELVEKNPKDLDEAYSHMNKTQRKRYLAFLGQIVSDAERYMFSKKATRKTKVAKPKTADKQVKNLKYLATSAEYKLTSVNAVNIIGSHKLWVFNTKNRHLFEYVSYANGPGFEVSGSTLKNVDLDNSRETTLRKPDEFLPMVLKKTPTQIRKEWDALTTKTSIPNGRINKDCIILRVE